MRATARELSLASERLRASLDQQHRFVSMTSHEFRTPLSVIVSSSDLLHAYSERWDAEQRNKHLDRIARSARGMTDLLDGLLLIGRTDAGHVDFRPTRTDVLGLVQEVAENQRLRAKNDVSVVVTHALGERPVRIDPRLVRHVLDNLVSNAVKYSTAAGKVEIDVSIVGSQMRIRVSDHGIGIPAEDLSRLFSSFHRSDNVGLVPGAGLGLAIVKRAVEQHRGTIEVRSEVGVGTTFEVFLPVELLEADDMGSSEGNAS